jgi:hypothetical protein
MEITYINCGYESEYGPDDHDDKFNQDDYDHNQDDSDPHCLYDDDEPFAPFQDRNPEQDLLRYSGWEEDGTALDVGEYARSYRLSLLKRRWCHMELSDWKREMDFLEVTLATEGLESWWPIELIFFVYQRRLDLEYFLPKEYRDTHLAETKLMVMRMLQDKVEETMGEAEQSLSEWLPDRLRDRHILLLRSSLRDIRAHVDRNCERYGPLRLADLGSFRGEGRNFSHAWCWT